MNQNSDELKQWSDTTEQAVQNAQEIALELATQAIVSETAEGLKRSLNAMSKEVAGRLAKASNALASSDDVAQQARLGELVARLKEEHSAVKKLELLGPALLEEPHAVEYAMERLRPEIEAMLQAGGRSRVAEAALVGGAILSGISPAYAPARTTVQAAYDLTAVSIAWARINQGNQTAEQNLAAVKSLDTVVKKLVAEIGAAKSDPE